MFLAPFRGGLLYTLIQQHYIQCAQSVTSWMARYLSGSSRVGLTLDLLSTSPGDSQGYPAGAGATRRPRDANPHMAMAAAPLFRFGRQPWLPAKSVTSRPG